MWIHPFSEELRMKKNKSFDCVEMKNRIQQELRKEYEARKTEFSSYADFINATAGESQEIKEYRERMATSSQPSY